MCGGLRVTDIGVSVERTSGSSCVSANTLRFVDQRSGIFEREARPVGELTGQLQEWGRHVQFYPQLFGRGALVTHGGRNLTFRGVPLDEAKVAVLMLHGRGDSARGILELANVLSVADVAYAAPEAEGNSWYPQSFLVYRWRATNLSCRQPCKRLTTR